VVLTQVSVKITVFWHVKPHTLVYVNRFFYESCNSYQHTIYKIHNSILILSNYLLVDSPFIKQPEATVRIVSELAIKQHLYII
jgi:hypothetical protein